MTFLRRGQNLIDLALLIGVVGLVMVGMEAYIRRGVQGKIKDVTESVKRVCLTGKDKVMKTKKLITKKRLEN